MIAGREKILAPLPDVAGRHCAGRSHRPETHELAPYQRSHRWPCRDRVSRLADVAAVFAGRRQFIYPWIDGLLQPAARRHFPFGSRSATCPRPLAVSLGVFPGTLPRDDRAGRESRPAVPGGGRKGCGTGPIMAYPQPGYPIHVDIIGQGSCKTKLQPYRSASVVYRVARTKSPNCRLLTESKQWKFANGDLSDRTFAVIGKPVVVRSHQEGAADWRAPAARDDSPARVQSPCSRSRAFCRHELSARLCAQNWDCPGHQK